MGRLEKLAEREAERDAPRHRDPVLVLVALGIGGALAPSTGGLSIAWVLLALGLWWAPRRLARRAGEKARGLAQRVQLALVTAIPLGVVGVSSAFLFDQLTGRPWARHDAGLHYVFLPVLLLILSAIVGGSAWRALRESERETPTLRRRPSSDMPREVALALLVGLGAGLAVGAGYVALG